MFIFFYFLRTPPFMIILHPRFVFACWAFAAFLLPRAPPQLLIPHPAHTFYSYFGFVLYFTRYTHLLMHAPHLFTSRTPTCDSPAPMSLSIVWAYCCVYFVHPH